MSLTLFFSSNLDLPTSQKSSPRSAPVNLESPRSDRAVSLPPSDQNAAGNLSRASSRSSLCSPGQQNVSTGSGSAAGSSGYSRIPRSNSALSSLSNASSSSKRKSSCGEAAVVSRKGSLVAGKPPLSGGVAVKSVAEKRRKTSLKNATGSANQPSSRVDASKGKVQLIIFLYSSIIVLACS